MSQSHIATQRRPEHGTFLALSVGRCSGVSLPIREVISVSMEPSAEMIEPRYVNEGTNLSLHKFDQFAVNGHRGGNCRTRGYHHGFGLVQLWQLADL